MKYEEILKIKTELANDYGKEESAILFLLLHCSNMESSKLYSSMKEEIKEDTLKKFNEYCDKYIIENIPSQYLIGYEIFYGHEFHVNESVLIPRFETEELVEHILYAYDDCFLGQKVRVADIGTGSGCIGITLALEENNMDVTITDISMEALEVAKGNAKKLKADVTIVCGDMLEPLKGQKFDILVSNPPYIPNAEDVESLVKDNEPHLALFGGDDGLKFYRNILSNAKEILNDKAFICFEHAFDKKEEMISLFHTYFPEADVTVIKDMQGKDRITIAKIGCK